MHLLLALLLMLLLCTSMIEPLHCQLAKLDWVVYSQEAKWKPQFRANAKPSARRHKAKASSRILTGIWLATWARTASSPKVIWHLSLYFAKWRGSACHTTTYSQRVVLSAPTVHDQAKKRCSLSLLPILSPNGIWLKIYCKNNLTFYHVRKS